MKICYNNRWKRGRVVEGARLEIVWARKGLEGSNPFASATAPEDVLYGFVLRIESFRFRHALASVL